MGLKTTNYTIEELGITLPNAYAYISNLSVYGEKGRADFVVQTSRDSAIKLQPLKTVSIEFDVDRNENPLVTAYRYAKNIRTYQKGIHTMTETMPFYGWEDDFYYNA